MSFQVDVSIIIGFKDWGLERLELSVKSLMTALDEISGEVIISDFGSSNSEEIRTVASRLGAVYCRTDNVGVWSRSRAINAGYDIARGRVLIATDADMLFTPLSMKRIVNFIDNDPNSAVVLQCRDLPEEYSHTNPDVVNPNWPKLEIVSQIRPRWGMGGMFATHRDNVFAVGGYDSRMHTYGGEDLDFAQRIRRSGIAIHWIEDRDVRMYHIWHPATIKSVQKTQDGQDAVNFNRSILKTDLSWKRNTIASRWQMKNASPICSLIIPISESLDLETNSYYYSRLTDYGVEVIFISNNSELDVSSLQLDGRNAPLLLTAKNTAEPVLEAAIAAVNSPFVTVVDSKLFLDTELLPNVIDSFIASRAMVFAPIAEVSKESHDESEKYEIWSSFASILRNSLLFVRTSIVREIDLYSVSHVHWNQAMAQRLLSAGVDFGVFEELLGVKILPAYIEPSTRSAKIPDFASEQIDLITSNKSFRKQVSGYLYRIVPSGYFNVSGVVSGNVFDEIDTRTKEIIARGETSIVVDYKEGFTEVVSIIDDLEPFEIDVLESAGYVVDFPKDNVRTIAERRRELNSAGAVELVFDKLMRSLPTSEVADSFAVLAIENSSEDDFEKLVQITNDCDYLFAVVVNDSTFTAAFRPLSDAGNIQESEVWFTQAPANSLFGIVHTGSLPVVVAQK